MRLSVIVIAIGLSCTRLVQAAAPVEQVAPFAAGVRWPWLLLAVVLLAVGAIGALLWRQRRMARVLANEIALRMRLEQKLREHSVALEQSATTDRLTGLWNRRKFEELAVIEIGRARRYGHPLAIVSLDLDDFKQTNARHGTAIGDMVLVEVARLLRHNVRQSDSVGRWGGEEFLVLAPGASAAEAEHLATKLRNLIAAHAFHAVGDVSACAGVAVLAPNDELQHLVSRADAALREAKAGARGAVADSAADRVSG